MKKKFLIIIGLMVLFFHSNLFSQKINRNQIIWDFKFDCQNFYSFWTNVPIRSISIDGQSVSVSRDKVDYIGLGDYSVGLGWLLYRPLSRFDYYLNFNWRKIGFNIDDEPYKSNHAMSYLQPQAGIMFRFSNYTHDFRWKIALGSAYNHAMKYESTNYDDIKALNSGFSTVIGFGFEHSSGQQNNVYDENNYTVSSKHNYQSIMVNYSFDNYSIFNTDFSPDGKSKPYSNWKSNWGTITVTLIIRGSFESKRSN